MRASDHDRNCRARDGNRAEFESTNGDGPGTQAFHLVEKPIGEEHCASRVEQHDLGIDVVLAYLARSEGKLAVAVGSFANEVDQLLRHLDHRTSNPTCPKR